MTRTIALSLAALALSCAPALAAACSGSFALDKEYYSERDINDYNMSLLQGRGVDVTRAEMWGGCIRAWVPTADGREEMQFYEPLTMRRVE